MNPLLKEWLWGLAACILGAAGGFVSAHLGDLPQGYGAVIAGVLAVLADGARHAYNAVAEKDSLLPPFDSSKGPKL